MKRPRARRNPILQQLVYDAVYALLILVSSPVLLVLFLTHRNWRAGLGQRLGFVPRRRSDRPAMLIHGVSAGEILAAKHLVCLVEKELPGLDLVFTTGTVTGREAALRAYEGRQVVFFPLDFSFASRRTMSRLRPSLVLLMELELWPNFLLTTSGRSIPVVLANGRMSPRSRRNYRVLQSFIPEPMDRVDHYCVQSQEYGDRFRALGVPEDRITTTGSMKFDNVAEFLPGDVLAHYRELLGLTDEGFVLMGGSTHPGEEGVLLDAFEEILEVDPRARLIICPRHPEKDADVEVGVRARGHDLVRLSTLGLGGPPPEQVASAVVLADTVGELARLYAVADLVFVGGSLTRRGGQNMMEPAGLGKPVVVGPNTWNFRDPVDLLLSRGGLLQVPDADAVRRALVELHGDAVRRRDLGERARRVCLESKGATRRILDILRDFLPADVRATPVGGTSAAVEFQKGS